MIRGTSVRSALNDFLAALIITAVVSMAFTAHYASGEAVNLTTNIQSTISFTTSHSNFGNLTPGTPLFATTTLHVETNNTAGWEITLSGDNVTGNDTAETDQAMDLDSDASVNITDLDPQWIPGAATSTAGNAVTISSGDDVLGFRVMTASGSNLFLSSAWWGTDDTPYTNALWAGLASSSAADLRIGDTDRETSSGTVHNSVQYYLDVAPSQQTGNYTAELTYTASAN